MSGATLIKLDVPSLVPPSQLGPLVGTYFDTGKFNTTGDVSGVATGPVTTTAGQLIVLLGGSEDTSDPLSNPSGNSNAFTLRSSATAASNAWGGIWTATDAAGGTNWTLSLSSAVAVIKKHGWAAMVFPAGSTVGHSPTGKAVNGAATIDVVTTAANSSIVAAIFDWNVQAVAVNWPSINGFLPNSVNQGEKARIIISGSYNVYITYYPDVGPAGTKTITGGGLTFNNIMVAQEIKLPVGGGSPPEFEGWGVPI